MTIEVFWVQLVQKIARPGMLIHETIELRAKLAAPKTVGLNTIEVHYPVDPNSCRNS